MCAVFCLLFVDCYVLFVVSGLISFVCGSVFVVRCLLFVV